MNLIKVESSNVEMIGYEKGNLYIKYKNGLYEYNQVPETIYKDLLESISKGRFINLNIKRKFNYTKVG